MSDIHFMVFVRSWDSKLQMYRYHRIERVARASYAVGYDHRFTTVSGAVVAVHPRLWHSLMPATLRAKDLALVTAEIDKLTSS